MDIWFSTGHGENHSVFIRVCCGKDVVTFWSEGQIPVVAARALEEAIDRHMENRIKAIRRHAYNHGWQDAKRRERKKTEFYNCLNGDPSDVGY